MIKAILVFNNHGKPRLSKFYQYFVSIIYYLHVSIFWRILRILELQIVFCISSDWEKINEIYIKILLKNYTELNRKANHQNY